MLSKMSLGSFLSWIHKLSMSWRRNESSEPFPLKMWEASKLTERTLWVDAVVAVQFVCVVPGLGRWWIRRTLASWTGCWRRWWGECRSRRATIAVHLLRMAEEKGNFFTAFTDCICWLHPGPALLDVTRRDLNWDVSVYGQVPSYSEWFGKRRSNLGSCPALP